MLWPQARKSFEKNSRSDECLGEIPSGGQDTVPAFHDARIFAGVRSSAMPASRRPCSCECLRENPQNRRKAYLLVMREVHLNWVRSMKGGAFSCVCVCVCVCPVVSKSVGAFCSSVISAVSEQFTRLYAACCSVGRTPRIWAIA